ncbi:MAG: 3-hydroxyacyl-CoA dehydrogenase NAD-binding domain-containing protein [Pirellulaceae bacterium]|nr:3-hydroxyacyl-CoA dehydrogenase NAD-binding domain-containing protein [Pirellulaceae bacterium]
MSQPKIERVLIVGAGWVGRQIAARMAQHGVDVWLFDRKREVCEQSLDWMRSIANAPVETSSSAVIPDWLSKVNIAEQLFVSSVQLVIESVPEQVSLKKRVLSEISQRYAPPTIVASNSSYFTPTMLSRFVVAPERFAHFHFHVPVQHESVADIVGCETTEPGVIDQLSELSARIGQSPLRLRHEQPGYVFNWLLQSLLRASLELVAKDVTDPAEIDRSWKAVTNMPLGPFGMMDRIGLDVIEQVLSNARWANDDSVSLDRLIEVLQGPLREGNLGVKTGKGFYDYREES